MTKTYQNYVDGEWVGSTTGETFETTNPAAPDEVVAEYPAAGDDDAERAIRAANEAASAWAATPGPQRGAILRRAAGILDDRSEELTERLTAEEGKTHAEAGGEVQRAVDIFYYFAEQARDLAGERKAASGPDTNLYTREEPVGVAALITPWNYPIAIPAWRLAPALAAGTTAVLKPASLAPGPAVELFEALDEAGLPDGVANVVTASGSTGSYMVAHEDVDAVSFTGSTAVGTQVYETAVDRGARAQCEMGGKNPTVVAADADPAAAAEIVAAGGFGVTGQACTACSRAIVHEDVHDEFVSELVAAAEAIEVGPGDEYDMGPQVSETELEGTLDYIDVAADDGATLATGGGRPAGDRFGDGYFVEPTVFTDVDRDDRIAQEEVFGPVVAVIEVGDFEEAVAVANDSDYGLSASVVMDDHTRANRFIDEVEAGVAKVNEKTTGLELHVPFGGVKDSSTETWREQGRRGLDFYTLTKTVYDNF